MRNAGVGRVAELADHQPAAGPGHPGHLAQRGVGVVHVAQRERDRHRVEGGVGERQPQRVPGQQRHLRAGRACRPAACRGRSRRRPRTRRTGPAPRSRRRCRRPGPAPARPGAGRARPGWPGARPRSCPKESTVLVRS